jgi:hypothetical protein
MHTTNVHELTRVRVHQLRSKGCLRRLPDVLDDAVLNERGCFRLFDWVGLGLHILNLFFLGVRDECEGCLLKHKAWVKGLVRLAFYRRF